MFNRSTVSKLPTKLNGKFFQQQRTQYRWDDNDEVPPYWKEGRVSNLKLEAQQIRDFTGLMMDWTKWKNRTECAFDGSGYGKVLTDSEFAKNDLMMNRIVYAQLSVATSDGKRKTFFL